MSLEDIGLVDKIEDATDEDLRRVRRRGRKLGCLNCCLAWLLALVVIAGIGYLTLRLVVGPAVKKISQVPADFPQAFAIYRVDQAAVKMQNQETQKIIATLFEKAPAWLWSPFWRYVSDKAKTDLFTRLGDELKMPQNFSATDFKNLLSDKNIDEIKTVWLSWDKLDKTKEEMAAFYKKTLAENGFRFQENLSDYRIDLGFWKDETFGSMSFADHEENESSSVIEMMVNYFNR